MGALFKTKLMHALKGEGSKKLQDRMHAITSLAKWLE